MDNRTLVTSLDESVAQFNIISEGELIKIAMKYIGEIQTQETVPTLINFRACLKNYDDKTDHEHQDEVDDLIFKIDAYLDQQVNECTHE
jgi:hypothetical protein